ncbi:MAG: topoisomerase IV [Clostridiales Family XIII bacterium]|jgi:DNA gyrase subunit A|nr:topoisomerase IV [Clostridiales Family XIII bacterium]
MAKAKKKSEVDLTTLDQLQKEIPISRVNDENYMPYAMSVLYARAIPEIDGFKPSHRKLLYTMYKMGLLKGNKAKCSNIVGQTMKLNPHGDAAIYETLVRLTTGNESLLNPVVDSKGNMGKRYGRDMAYAAARYTEAKLAPMSAEFFAGLSKNSTDMVDNFDGTMKEPTLFPTRFPNILANPNMGIAVGMASNICSFNLRELCTATILRVKSKSATNESTKMSSVAEILEVMPAPDFPSGGYIINNPEEMKNIYLTGRGSFLSRSKYQIDEKGRHIEVLEIPYSTTIEAITEGIIDLVKKNKLPEVSDVRDETDMSGLKITIDYKKGTDPELLMAKLYKLTKLEDSFGCNFNVSINKQIRTLGVLDILDEWITWRLLCQAREVAYDLGIYKDKLHLLLGLQKLLLDIDKAIAIIRNTENDKEVIPALMAGFDIDEIQAEYIAEIKLRNLNKRYIIDKTAEIANHEKNIKRLEKILGSPAEQKKLIIKDLEEVADLYGKDRKSQIIHIDELEDDALIIEEPSFTDYDIKIFRTDHGYIKKIPTEQILKNPDIKLKDDDTLLQEIDATNGSDLLFFSDKGTVYKSRARDITDCKNADIGEYLPNLFELEDGESIVFICATVDYAGWILAGFKNGKVAKITLKSYQTKTNRKKLVNGLSTLSPVIAMYNILEDVNMSLISDLGKKIIVSSSLVNEKTSKNTQGVQTIRLTRATLEQFDLVGGNVPKKDQKYLVEKIPNSGKPCAEQVSLL